MPEIDKFGNLVFWSNSPIALWMKPKDSGGLWKVGMFIEHKSNIYCIVMDEEGKLQECRTALIKPYRSLAVSSL